MYSLVEQKSSRSDLIFQNQKYFGGVIWSSINETLHTLIYQAAQSLKIFVSTTVEKSNPRGIHVIFFLLANTWLDT